MNEYHQRKVVEYLGIFSKTKTNSMANFTIEDFEFEHMLHEDGIQLIKFWFDISKKEQDKRFQYRLSDPLKRWKFSPVGGLVYEIPPDP